MDQFIREKGIEVEEKKISRHEYLIALDTVEAYHKQINLFNAQKTPVKTWYKLQECSSRLRRILKKYNNEFIEDLVPYEMTIHAGCGRTTLNEFLKLRGDQIA